VGDEVEVYHLATRNSRVPGSAGPRHDRMAINASLDKPSTNKQTNKQTDTDRFPSRGIVAQAIR
jgi:hypothetical protein